MYAAGLRVSELVSLKQSDVDLHTGMVVCLEGSKRAARASRQSAIHWLQRYAVVAAYGKQDSTIMFLQRGKPFTRYGVANYQTLCRECWNRNVSPHTLRHSFATPPAPTWRRFEVGAGSIGP